MEFSSIGSYDSIEEAVQRIESCEILIVWGEEAIIGVITNDELGKSGTCGQICELDILVDPTPEMAASWKPKFIITTDDGEPVMVSRGP